MPKIDVGRGYYSRRHRFQAALVIAGRYIGRFSLPGQTISFIFAVISMLTSASLARPASRP